jgi:putative inorganic carbon (HCO3(-)) transporter
MMASRSSDKIAWNWKMVWAALLGFAFFSPWSIAGAQMCLGVGLFFWIVSLFFSPRRPLIVSPLFWPMAAYLGWQLVSVLLSPDPLTGLRAVRAEWIILLFFLVINFVDQERWAHRLVDVLVLTAALVGLYAIWQHWAGWDLYRQRPLRATGGVFEATGLFGHHLTFGGYVMMVLMLSGSLCLFGTRGFRRIIYGVSSLVLILSLLFSYARSAWLGFLAGVLAITLVRNRKALTFVLVGIAIVILAVALFLPSAREQAGEAAALFQNPMVNSSRLQMWSAALRLIRDHPFLGAGVGQAARLLPNYGCDLGYAHVHNDLLNAAANSGLLGLATFLWMWVAFLRLANGCRRGRRGNAWTTAMATAGLGIVVAFLVAGLFQCYYTDAEDGMVLWFCLGLVIAVCAIERKEAGSPASPRTSRSKGTEDEKV